MTLKKSVLEQQRKIAIQALDDLLNDVPPTVPGRANTVNIPQLNAAGDWEHKSYRTSKMILENQPNKVGLHWVYVLVEARIKDKKERIRKKFNTAVQVSLWEWDKDGEEVKPKSQLSFERNNQINTLYNKVNTTITELRTGKYVELSDDLKDLEEIFGNGLKREKAKSKSLTDYIKEYVEFRKRKGTPRGTYKEFLTVMNRIKDYEKEKEKIIYLKDINLTLSDDLISFWAYPTETRKAYHPNTIKKTFEVLVTILNHLYARKDETKIDLSDTYTKKQFGEVQEYQQEPIALDEDEVKKIVEFDFEKYYQEELVKLEKMIKKEKLEFKRKFLISGLKQRKIKLELTRDRALLQMSTGLRVGDLFTIQENNVGKEILTIRPNKTLLTKKTNETNIKLFPIARKVLAKYNNNTTKKPFKVTEQNYNKSIKDMLEVTGIDTSVEVVEFDGFTATKLNKKKFEVMTSHNFRDTFITTAIRNNVPIPIILKWTNQESYDVMKKYINLTKKDVTHQVDMFL